ncbi:galactose mutarotase-like protein [Punctularia strigosozonata HHB-11173 SS5]|uniref:galactose mutarotase-like protein n=1 Tax=Punctularia strigosozonata (strain HHB-11173) TaxID=741275 RepID=UPI0004416BF6|nr:galactose mutarotase-like protein [Punctularia strigosozonata HHB-11173 SS5]EIN13736.1 galactose mutarotase-like protein [Punctularia strigosozonata HHB-11173 SS5]
MPVDRTTTKVTLKHPKGSSVEILLYGASVISWKAASPNSSEIVERLFVSSKAFLDGSKPVRGGIPVVFPCFGAPTHPDHLKLSQHGFARSETWTFDSVVMDNEAGVSVRFTLDPTSSIIAKYDKPFHLAYVVTLAEHQLSTDLHVKNISAASAPSATPLEFQALFHNYIAAPANDALIFPLTDKSYFDKTDTSLEGKNALKTETRAGVDVTKFTDSVYEDAGGKYEVKWPGGGVQVKTNLKDVVVWNPQETGASIGDMEDGGWLRYVCVEPGHVRGFVSVDPGKEWIGQQVISVLDH